VSALTAAARTVVRRPFTVGATEQGPCHARAVQQAERSRRTPAELYAQAKRTDDPAARGRLLEDVLLRLFETAHFDVEKNPGAAAPRQTDLVARYGERVYIVEAKWTSRPAGIADVDGLRARLGRATRGATGLLVSIGGFAAGTAEDVRNHRHQPLLLMSAGELERLVYGQARLRDLLDRKCDKLAFEGEVLVEPDSAAWSSDPDAPHGARRRGAPRIVDGSGKVLPWVRATGTFDVWLPALHLPDPDWRWAGQSGSVYTKATISNRGPASVHRILDELDRVGWLSRGCTWALRQTGANWFGFGAAGLTAALDGWSERYADWGGTAHHTETLAVVGETDGNGSWLIEADLDAGPARWVTSCDVTAVLEGWPLDPEPLRRLLRAVGAAAPQVLRPFTKTVVATDWLPRDEPAVLDVRARIVVTDTGPDGTEEDWVVGVVARHPGLPRTAEEIERSPWRAWTRDNDVLPVAVRSWHRDDFTERTYRLLQAQWTEVSGAVPGVLVCDWD
jgi:hypothetical protein